MNMMTYINTISKDDPNIDSLCNEEYSLEKHTEPTEEIIYLLKKCPSVETSISKRFQETVIGNFRK